MKNVVQLDILSSIAERDAGIQTAITHADAVTPDWSSMAYEELKRFLKITPGEFMGENFRSHCAQIDFPLPPHARAFGGIIVKAYKSGLIRRVRFDQVSNKKAHACFASVWIKA